MLDLRCIFCDCRQCICPKAKPMPPRHANFKCVCGAHFKGLTDDELDSVIETHELCEPDEDPDYYFQIGVK